jgi:hypothetical protein
MGYNKGSNALRLLMLLIGTVVVGALLSTLYLYLMPTVIGIDIRLGAVLAVGFGTVAGIMAGLMVGFFKVVSFKKAMAVVILGCLLFSYYKWALYVANDAEESLVIGNASEYLAQFTNIMNPNPALDEDEMMEVLVRMTTLSAYEFESGERWWDDYVKNLTDEEIQMLRDYSYYELYYSDYFGEIPAAAHTDEKLMKEFLEDILRQIKNESHYAYVLHLIENRWDFPSAIWYMINPVKLFDVVMQINEEGRWFIYNEGDDINNIDNVRGQRLALIWLGEFLLICVPMISVTIKRVRHNDITGFVHLSEEDKDRMRAREAYSAMYKEDKPGGMGSAGGKAPTPSQQLSAFSMGPTGTEQPAQPEQPQDSRAWGSEPDYSQEQVQTSDYADYSQEQVQTSDYADYSQEQVQTSDYADYSQEQVQTSDYADYSQEQVQTSDYADYSQEQVQTSDYYNQQQTDPYYGQQQQTQDPYYGQYGQQQQQPDPYYGQYGQQQQQPDPYYGQYGQQQPQQPDPYYGQYGQQPQQPDPYYGQYGQQPQQPDPYYGQQNPEEWNQ